MAQVYDRDLIGYGPNPPDPKWPNGARLAVNFVMNYEEGSEPSVQDGEGYSETGLTESHGVNQGVKAPRPGRRDYVRVRQPRGLLAVDAAVLRHNWARLGRRRPDALATGPHARGPVGNGSSAQGSLNLRPATERDGARGGKGSGQAQEEGQT